LVIVRPPPCDLGTTWSNVAASAWRRPTTEAPGIWPPQPAQSEPCAQRSLRRWLACHFRFFLAALANGDPDQAGQPQGRLDQCPDDMLAFNRPGDEAAVPIPDEADFAGRRRRDLEQMPAPTKA